MDIISEAEDNLDDIIYSTRTIDINEVLKLEEEKKKQQRKAGKNNEKSRLCLPFLQLGGYSQTP